MWEEVRSAKYYPRIQYNAKLADEAIKTIDLQKLNAMLEQCSS